MTETTKGKAIGTANMILHLMTLLEHEERTYGSTIRVKQKLREVTTRIENIDYLHMVEEAWTRVLDKYRDKKYRIAPFHAIETLAFNEEQALIEMFGNNIMDEISRFTLKITHNVDKLVISETISIVDDLTEALRKVIFEHKIKRTVDENRHS